MPKTVPSSSAWYNGELGPLESGAPSVASISLHLGTGVFDGLMAYWNRDHYYLHYIDEHLDRFVHGASRMDLAVSWSPSELRAGIEGLLALEPQCTQYVRPIAYRRAPELWVTGNKQSAADVAIFTVRVPRDEDHLISCHISPIERISSRAVVPQTKVSGTYVNSYRTRTAAEAAGFDDGIMLERSGLITEASAANVFVVVKGELLTPQSSPEIFPGITRGIVLAIAGELGIPARELPLCPQDFERADAAFLCSTLMEIRGISRIGDHFLGTAADSAFLRVRNRFRSLTHT